LKQRNSEDASLSSRKKKETVSRVFGGREKAALHGKRGQILHFSVQIETKGKRKGGGFP